MPDTRHHRGAHAEDAISFAASREGVLRRATEELSWLLGRGYSDGAALTLVGDRHQLVQRQRMAVRRAACSDDERAARRAKRVERADTLRVDGFNCLITVEAMLSHGPIFVGRDGALRDLASVHGTYRSVEETVPALHALRETLEALDVREVEVLLDRPVGNSGRLRAALEEVFAGAAFAFAASLHDAVDPVLVTRDGVIASSDSWILERARAWLDLPAAVARQRELALWRLDLG